MSFLNTDLEQIIEVAGMVNRPPGEIRLEETPRLVEAAIELGLIDSSVSVMFSVEYDMAVQVTTANGLTLISEWIGDHFQKHLLYGPSNVKIVGALLNWVVEQAQDVTRLLLDNYTVR